MTRQDEIRRRWESGVDFPRSDLRADIEYLLGQVDALADKVKQLEERQNWQVDVAEANAAHMVAAMAEAEVEELKDKVAEQTERGDRLAERAHAAEATVARVEALEKQWRDGDQYDQDAAAYLRDALNGTEDES